MENDNIFEDNNLELSSFFDSANPFAEEFDPSDVVNREDDNANPLPDLKKNGHSNGDNSHANGFLSKNDLKDLAQNSKSAIDISSLGLFANEEEKFSNVIKKEDIDLEASRVSRPYSSKEFDDAEKSVRSMHYNFEFSDKDLDSDEEEKPYDQAGELRSKFKDFLELPKISGSYRSNEGNKLLPSEFVTQNGHKLQISDEPPFDEIEHKSSSVVVNRSEYGEIESIEVYCKCGERTFIKFDFVDDDGADETESINDELKSFKSFSDINAENFSGYIEKTGDDSDLIDSHNGDNPELDELFGAFGEEFEEEEED